ncbi:MAG: hypothetical protein JO332_09765, partial [Planctomycetaceae bacterium]|nr:hypothetical protein [Planctomycetaceae bacterium]
MSPLPARPTVVGDYEVFENQIISRGDSGVLCRGCQRSEGRKVSIKLMSDAVLVSAEDLARCREESAALEAASHENIIPVVGSGYWKGRLFFAMEEVEGETLATYLQNGYRFSTVEILQV